MAGVLTRSEKERAYQREWSRRWRSDPLNAKRLSEKSRAWQKRNPVRFAISQYKKNAKLKCLQISISDREIESLILARCEYCGAPPSPVNGIDRLDNDRGYLADNVTTACADCNYAKRKMSIDAFKAWVTRAARHMGVT